MGQCPAGGTFRKEGMQDETKYPLPKFHYPARRSSQGPRQMPKAQEPRSITVAKDIAAHHAFAVGVALWWARREAWLLW
jgi:hypothetical protein